MCNENTIHAELTPPSAAIRSMQQTGPMPVTELDVIVHTCAGLADAVLHIHPAPGIGRLC